VDKDQATMQDWIAQAGSALPHLFIADGDGAKAWEGPLPATRAEMLALCKKWGAAQ
jgi:hypothetical protein